MPVNSKTEFLSQTLLPYTQRKHQKADFLICHATRFERKERSFREERQQQWEQRLGITRQEVEALLLDPEQIVPDDEGVFVAQSKRGNGLLRVAYIQIGSTQRILTLYWTNQFSRYWQENLS